MTMCSREVIFDSKNMHVYNAWRSTNGGTIRIIHTQWYTGVYIYSDVRSTEEHHT